jgi:hypothetical protein
VGSFMTAITTFKDGGLGVAMLTVEPRVKAAIWLAAGKINSDGIAWMKSNAPWTDRTGNARNGLNGVVNRDGDWTSITFFHSVPYGIWLEVRWSGKYSIIGPAVEEFGPKYMSLASKMAFAVGGGI